MSKNSEYKITSSYCLKTGRTEHFIYRYKDGKIVERGFGNLSWKFSQYELAEAVCQQLNNQVEKETVK